jgi:hypothetical protein
MESDWKLLIVKRRGGVEVGGKYERLTRLPYLEGVHIRGFDL